MYMNRPSDDSAAGGDLVDAWFQVGVFVAAVDAQLGKWLTDRYGIGVTEYRALCHLTVAPDKELRINELAGRIGLNQSSVTRLLGRLEGKKLTRRETCFDDGRGVYAVLTADGDAVVADAREPYRARLAEALSEAAAATPAPGGLIGGVLAAAGHLPDS